MPCREETCADLVGALHPPEGWMLLGNPLDEPAWGIFGADGASVPAGSRIASNRPIRIVM